MVKKPPPMKTTLTPQPNTAGETTKHLAPIHKAVDKASRRRRAPLKAIGGTGLNNDYGERGDEDGGTTGASSGGEPGSTPPNL